VRILGEDLVCYRDLAGTIGLIGDRCPHRYVSLEWGVAAEVGLRCPYHGWCFDESGQCIDIPIGGIDMQGGIALAGYPVQEHGGILFAYLGAGEPPAPPAIAYLLEQSGDAEASFCVLDAPFKESFSRVQDLSVAPSVLGEIFPNGASSSESEAECASSDGVVRGVRRYVPDAANGTALEVRATYYAPFYSLIVLGERRTVRMRVPADDARTLLITHVSFDQDAERGNSPRVWGYEVAALDSSGMPLFDADAPSVDEAGYPVASEFSVASVEDLEHFLEGTLPAGVEPVWEIASSDGGAGSRSDYRQLEIIGVGPSELWRRQSG
jgi:nitrite reductase/ring-hydroxylating ferredoxin subunit